VPNTGSLGGVFGATGPADTVPVIGRPVSTATSGTQGIRFDGTDFLQLVDALGGSLITAPAGITGADPSASIEAWVWNPGIPGEETMVSWGHRDGPDGSNFSFNYGNDNRWGAMGHWGNPDAGWGAPDGVDKAPAAKQWHHLVYTYNDQDFTQRLYADGVPIYSETLAQGALNIWPDTPINLAAQTETVPETVEDDLRVTGGLRGSLTLGRVRIHDGVLTDAQVLANYNAEKAEFVEPVIPPPEPIPAELLVSVDATTLPEGTELNDIPNTGPLGGFFEATGGDGTIPIVDTPLPDATGGTRGIVFDGDDYMQLVTAAGSGTLLTAPASITGPDPASSVEVWVWNPTVPGEETMVSWGQRNGPDGSNYSFNYGNNPSYGAMGHWGSPDMGWTPSNNENAPTAQRWHHVVYTFDGTVQRVFVDGVLWNSEDLGPGALNIHANTPINLAAQVEPNPDTVEDPNDLRVTAPLRGSLTLGKVNIYKGVLTPAQIAANYNTNKAGFVEPVVPAEPVVKLVDIDATGLAPGAANSVANTGTLGGFFTPTGGDATVPVIGSALTSTSAPGTTGIRFDGTDYLQLTDADGNLITSPAEITGADPKISIETWVFNPGLDREETILSWGHRGTDGGNLSFNYGSDNAWGAVGHWGGSDFGWGPTLRPATGPTDASGAPAAGQWHHVAYTYDGTTSRAYIDGTLVNTEVPGENHVNTFPDMPITLAGQMDDVDPTTVEEFLRGSLTIGKARIYSGVLTDAQIAANFNAEKAGFVNPTAPAAAPLTAGPIHRYSFNNPTGAAGDGTVVEDLAGDADATVRGAGATFSGTRLVLPGGASATAAYVDLPNEILSSLGAANGGTGKVTFEGWVKNTGAAAWTRFYDFGTGSGGELTGPGGDGAGQDFFMLTASTDGGSVHRYEATDNDDGDPTGNMWHENTAPSNVDVHFAVTWDETTGTLKYYENGKEVGGFSTPVLISAINDINNWLGRSQFTGDANLKGEYDEFRIYNRALSAGEVLGDFLAGADVVNTGGVIPAKVAQVFVNGQGITGQTTANGIAFRNLAGVDNTFGYPVPGPNQLKTIPWSNGINKISIRFTQDVGATLSQDDLVVRGINTATYPISGFTYDAATKTGTWTLTNPIVNDKVNLFVDDALVGGLDGEWTTAQAYPSGNGTAGGDFTFRLNVLRGDANQDGAVNALDLGQLKAKLNRTATNPGSGTTGYSVFADLNADGQINALDLGIAKARLNNRLPNGEPAATSLLFSSRPISA